MKSTQSKCFIDDNNEVHKDDDRAKPKTASLYTNFHIHQSQMYFVLYTISLSLSVQLLTSAYNTSLLETKELVLLTKLVRNTRKSQQTHSNVHSNVSKKFFVGPVMGS